VKESNVRTFAAVSEVGVMLEMDAVECKIVRLVDAFDDELVAVVWRWSGREEQSAEGKQGKR